MGNPIRVLHAVVNMNRGGAETLIMNLYRNMDRGKIQFDFLTNKPGVFDEEIKKMGGVIHRIPYVTDVGHKKYIRHLNQFFYENKQYKIVHSHMDKMSGFVLQAAKKAGIPTRIAHSHNTQSEGGFAARVYKSYAGYQINRSSTHFLACSHAAGKWLFKKQHTSIDVVKNGIDLSKFAFSESKRANIRRELNLDPDNITIGHIGRFNHQKNHTLLIDIFHNFLKENPKSTLVLVGDGPLKSIIINKTKRLKIEDRVIFLGVRSDVEHLLQAFDVFVFPSLHEGLPVTLIEAQASGLPCVISDSITKEVDMGLNLIKFVSNTKMDNWFEELFKLNVNQMKRTITAGKLTDEGYNIHQTSEWTKEYYLGLSR
ncbi:glycosyltransferase family 1 protein [Metabacillus sp. cB07]|uniref:glycosyltransferase family 1 protein n=1 Tax=Metabacillus sp. cB07 TaxID=2806989 RepID=UPI001939EB63|nr:glycosyltransferase family 1 protein [Metabacillus sp. cB07]